MLYREALGEVLREERLDQKMTLRMVAEKSTLALGYLSEIERGQKELSSDLLESLAARGLGLETADVVIRAGMRMAGLGIPDTPESLYEIIDEYADLG
jgi:transcriptional regulator with XRE-family HTH domain